MAVMMCDGWRRGIETRKGVAKLYTAHERRDDVSSSFRTTRQTKLQEMAASKDDLMGAVMID